MAYIERTKTGKYRAHVEKKGVRDSRTFTLQREAKEWAAKREAEIVDAASGKYPRKSLGDVMDLYEKCVSSKKLRGDREVLRIEAFKRDFPELAAKVMSKTTTADWAEWRDKRLETVSGSSVVRDINLFSNIYQLAMHELGPYCGSSPFTRLKRPRENPLREQRWRWRATKQVLRWLGYRTRWVPRYADTKVANKQEEVAYAILVALRTAMRAQEVLSLSSANTNLVTCVATVRHKMQYTTGMPRKVPMEPQATRLLRVLAANPLGVEGQWFSMTPQQLDALWRKHRDNLAMAVPEVGDLHFHDTRAEAITRLSRKVDVLRLSMICGIKDLKLLNNRYYRETAEDVALRLGR